MWARLSQVSCPKVAIDVGAAVDHIADEGCVTVGNPVIGATAEFGFAVSHADQLAFAEISGDFNPLHLDAEFAKAKGMQDAVVYGALIVAKISRVIGMQLPGSQGIWSALKIDFRGPLYVGQTAHLSAEVGHYSEATRSLTVKIRVNCGDRLLATATALATLHAS
jgi:3-hydroxybutyryl-CoA dehydratase